MTRVNNGQIKIKASRWLSLMYDEDKYDKKWAEKGLCRGYSLIHVSTFGS
jgi:hypothetical protein